MERREPVIDDVMLRFLVYHLSLLSFLSWFVRSYLRLVSGIVMFVFMLSYVRCISLRLSEASWDLFGLGGPGQVPFWSILFIGWLTS